MGFLDEFKKLTHPYDDEDDDFFGSAADAQPDEERQTERQERRSSFFSGPEEAAPDSYGIPAAPKSRPAFRIPRRELRRQADAADAAEAQARPGPGRSRARRNPGCPWQSPSGLRTARGWPTTWLEGKTILLNLEKAGKVDSRRLLDFMSGAAYALQGYVRRVSGSIYLVVPNGEEVTDADAMSQMENSGLYL